MEESSGHRVTLKLVERGLRVVSVEELHPEYGLLRTSHRLSWEELNLLTEQLASITKSNLPLAPSLKALSGDLRSSRLKPILERVHEDLDRGATLEEALMKHHKAFPRVYISMLRAGEQTGNLAGILQLMVGYTARMAALKQNLAAILTYPLMVLLVGGFVMMFLLVKVVPVFSEIFNEFGGQLPWATRFWVDLADMTMHKGTSLWLSIAIPVILLLLLRGWMRRTERGRILLDSLRLKVPVVGRFHYLLSLTRFTRTLSILLKANVPVLDSLELAGAASGSPVLHRLVSEAGLEVASGETLSSSLAGTRYFGHTFCWMLSTGEQRGQTEEALESLAGSYEREAALYDRTWGTFLAPVIIVGLGITVGFLVISLYLPIFTLGDSISG